MTVNLAPFGWPRFNIRGGSDAVADCAGTDVNVAAMSMSLTSALMSKQTMNTTKATIQDMNNVA